MEKNVRKVVGVMGRAVEGQEESNRQPGCPYDCQ